MTKMNVMHLIDGKSAISDTKACQPQVFVNSSPCIKIGFFFNIEVSEGRTKNINYDTVLALLDTGADGVYVAPHLVEKYNCPTAKGGENITVNGEAGSKAHRGSLYILEEGRVLDMWVTPREFKSHGRPFDVVLGRRFLQFCNLHWDGPNRQVSLTIGENTLAY